MKDYSKVKYVKPSVDGKDITKCKVYEVVDFLFDDCYRIRDDVNDYITVTFSNKDSDIVHESRYNWIPCDKDGNEIEV